MVQKSVTESKYLLKVTLLPCREGVTLTNDICGILFFASPPLNRFSVRKTSPTFHGNDLILPLSKLLS